MSRYNETQTNQEKERVILDDQLSIPSSLRFRDAQKRQQSYLIWLAGLLLNLAAADKILVFCQTKAIAEAMAKASDTGFHHSGLPDEEKKKSGKQEIRTRVQVASSIATPAAPSADQPKHHDVPALTAARISVLEAYKLHESDSSEDWDNSNPVVPDIPYTHGPGLYLPSSH
ncbi:hypothetical protein F4604DRAFT_1934439 [Suillus subluteus]|nr:hypothetical protein F4604DRAFT_1687112 [Suillus subluteus]KAG1850431.1 hypothetical protein F4604DRAFT_1934439 [Suillus subluteus]